MMSLDIERVIERTRRTLQLQKSEGEKPHSGETSQHAPTQTPCNQPAIADLTHAQTQQGPCRNKHSSWWPGALADPRDQDG